MLSPEIPDEPNVSGTLIRALRDQGHDVLSVKESLRGAGADPESDNRRVLKVLASSIDWAGHFAVITDDRVRIQPLAEVPEKPC